jgi:hypothetical protein
MAGSTNTSPHCENGVLAVMAKLLRVDLHLKLTHLT